MDIAMCKNVHSARGRSWFAHVQMRRFISFPTADSATNCGTGSVASERSSAWSPTPTPRHWPAPCFTMVAAALFTRQATYWVAATSKRSFLSAPATFPNRLAARIWKPSRTLEDLTPLSSASLEEGVPSMIGRAVSFRRAVEIPACDATLICTQKCCNDW